MESREKTGKGLKFFKAKPILELQGEMRKSRKGNMP
jgi:hypothetical protein